MTKKQVKISDEATDSTEPKKGKVFGDPYVEVQ